MRLPYLVLSVLLVLSVVVDVYLYYLIRSAFRRRVWAVLHAIAAVIFNAAFLAVLLYPVRTASNAMLPVIMWTLYAYASVYIAKYIFVLGDVISRLPLLRSHRRWRWLSLVSAILAFAVFAVMWWGALVNRYNIQLNEVTVRDKTLPQAFDGLRVAVISDLHVGTFGSDTVFFSRLVSRVNSLRPDIILFAGDAVNRNSDELRPFVTVLRRLHAPLGVFSVLGNHDYGDYMDWPSPSHKERNLRLMKELQTGMGWRLLNNEHNFVHRGNDSIAIVGVENIGDPPFHVYGDLSKAYPHPGDGNFKILITHNPAHWDKDICENRDVNVALTVSGHTHAMQLSVPGFSPISWRYPHWGGLYSDSHGKALYVNIGAGEVGFPARIGATPEITLITLRR